LLRSFVRSPRSFASLVIFSPQRRRCGQATTTTLRGIISSHSPNDSTNKIGVRLGTMTTEAAAATTTERANNVSHEAAGCAAERA
jgi:hypothetical protein